jgi:hypothetical protein
VWDEGLAAFTHAHGEAYAECDASRVRADVAERDFFTQVRASSCRSKQLIDLGQMLEDRKIIPCL